VKSIHLRKLMRSVCNRIEGKFPGTIAEFEDFVSPREPFLRDQYAHMEVFNVAKSTRQKLRKFVDDIIIKNFYPRNLSLSVLIWTNEETSQYFKQDVEYIRRNRNPVVITIPDVKMIWEPAESLLICSKVVEKNAGYNLLDNIVIYKPLQSRLSYKLLQKSITLINNSSFEYIDMPFIYSQENPKKDPDSARTSVNIERAA